MWEGRDIVKNLRQGRRNKRDASRYVSFEKVQILFVVSISTDLKTRRIRFSSAITLYEIPKRPIVATSTKVVKSACSMPPFRLSYYRVPFFVDLNIV